MALSRRIGEPIDEPLMNLEKWLSGDDLAALADVSPRMAKKAISACRWRGAELVIQEVKVARGGAGGKVRQVHVDSLPADLREAWYLERGIALHEELDPETGQTITVPEQAYRNDAKHEANLALARWRHEVIRPALAYEAGSAERAAMVKELAAAERMMPNGKRKRVTGATLYNWIGAFDAEGLSGLMRRRREDTGTKRVAVTRAWDAFFATHIDAATQARVAEELVRYIRSLWASGEPGKNMIAEKSTTRLIELSRDLRVVAFDALPLGRLGDTTRVKSQFGVCCVNGRMVRDHEQYRLHAIKAKDNAVWQDKYMPSIRRDYSDLLPCQIVVGDVHPVDIMCRRADGTTVHPQAISWFDIATNRMHMTFVFLEPKEGVRREHVAMSFTAMVEAWGLPQMLYLDNGSEYSDPDMMRGFTELSKLVEMGGGARFSIHDLAGDGDVSARVQTGLQSVVRSRAYNAKGKPGIEGAFGNLEQVFFAAVDGWVAGDRMKKKTHAKGKDPVAFPGGEGAFVEAMAQQLDAYHKRPQGGKLDGRSPNETLRDFVEGGWGKTVLTSTGVLELAFADIIERTPDRGRITYKPRRGPSLTYYADELLGMSHRVTVRVPAFDPQRVFVFDQDGALICEALPERTFGVLDPAGAEEGNRRGKVLRRRITDQAGNVARLELAKETERHLSHLPDAAEVPVAATVDAGMLDRLAERAALDSDELRAQAEAEKARPQIEQFKPKTVAFELLDDDEEENADE